MQRFLFDGIDLDRHRIAVCIGKKDSVSIASDLTESSFPVMDQTLPRTESAPDRSGFSVIRVPPAGLLVGVIHS